MGAVALGVAVAAPGTAHALYYQEVEVGTGAQRGCEHPDKPGDWYLSGMWALRNDNSKITCKDGTWYDSSGKPVARLVS